MVYAQYIGSCTPPAPYPRLPPVESRIACRRYDEATRVVIVWRSILDDALFPMPTHHLKGDECGWVVVQQTDANHARLLSYSTTKPPLVPKAQDSTSSVVRAPGMLTELLLRQVHASCDAVDLTIQRGLANTDEPSYLQEDNDAFMKRLVNRQDKLTPATASARNGVSQRDGFISGSVMLVQSVFRPRTIVL
ncbi:hypothetical protein SPRG_18288 [Saprolegnia parasitica CBS 223.65]|uniref:START domain-containing protein n=1 Tax=Saprolegnia parasitica (strain CBS 223.65) TaxID=695850 RepID=A0A067BNB7_SAPPC|nr:hypothetical protein SPRG_18288 [Saprolegnia parasitica CBS 223.65]KDO16177.1 hypothetical protein SPRG_18288 [Saprolegnia parasitica CBS 223.65]|eukprot:XP_012213116.1 hypothetical protein SPRG_18288 [Saprolegnia parasitica CBS 223.65]